MKTRFVFLLRSLLAVVLVTGLGGASSLHGAGQSAAAPQVSVSVRDDGSGAFAAGEPWHVAVRLTTPRGATRPFEIAPVSGTWVDAVLVELLAGNSGTVAAKAEPVGQPDTAVATLDAKRIAGGVWRFPAATTRSLTPGEYRLRVRLVLKAGRGWTGEATADEIPVRIVAATADTSSAGSSNIPAGIKQIMNRAEDALLAGQVETAAGLVDEALKRTPLDGRLLILRARIAERAGNLSAAVICANGALRAEATAAGRHPDAEFVALHNRLAAARRAGAVSSSPPPVAPAWSWPPLEVITAITADAGKSDFGRSMAKAPRATPAPTPSEPASRPPATPTAVPAPKTGEQPGSNTTAPRVAASTTTGAASVARGATPDFPSAGMDSGVVLGAAELAEETILADAAGQWASSAAAGSQYSSPNYAAAKLTGPPDVAKAGDSANAWCHGSASKAEEWVEVCFAKPVRATEVRVRQNNAPGAIVKVEAFEPDGTAHTWWTGVDPAKASAQATLAWFAVRVPRTSYRVAKVKLTLNLAAVPGWKEIDAVQLVGD